MGECKSCGRKIHFFNSAFGYCENCKIGDNKKEITIKIGKDDYDAEEEYCGHCGKKFHKKKDISGECQSNWCEVIFCKQCSNKCKKCGKFYCPKHINKHKCK